VPHRRSTRFFEQHPEAAAALENGRNWARSDRKSTFRPITSRSLSSSFSPHRGTRDTAGPPLLDPLATGETDRVTSTVHHAATNHVRP
jgi:hypothetical protein